MENVGIDIPMSDTPINNLSRHVFFFKALIIPIGIPKIHANAIADNASFIVLGNAFLIRLNTG